jgi:hypothetical protein
MWGEFFDAASCIDDAYMSHLGAFVGAGDEDSVLDALAMLFGYSI